MSNVYVNRTLNLKRIKYIGLDMDHTLIRYNSYNFESLAHDIMLKKLLEEKHYPEAIRSLAFDFHRAIRGLVIDKNKGNVLKLSRYAAIRGTYHGLAPLDYVSQQKLYKSTYIDLSDPDYDTVDTSFSIAFAGLFMQLVELKNTTLKDTLPAYRQIAEDLIAVLDRGHRDGSIKSVVKSRLDNFVIKDESTVLGLEKYKKHGKKIFVLTNSDFHYSKLL
jgi:HAD superfamily 5'-nucleotidase-like hydrolase